MMHKCRWCEGSGQLLVAECGWRPDDIREFNVECADCVGEGEVDQEAFTEQHDICRAPATNHGRQPSRLLSRLRLCGTGSRVGSNLKGTEAPHPMRFWSTSTSPIRLGLRVSPS